MRARIKVDPGKGARAYHCISRTVNSEWLFEESDRERLRQLIWLVAEFCGLEVITYAILSNHFHLLVRVPERSWVGPAEVLRRYLVLYPAPSRFRPQLIQEIKKEVANETPAGIAWLHRQRRQMGDLSQFMKILKQRYTYVFNAAHKRHGTLWSERYKSVLVESGFALATMAAYIDLNAVRAGLVEDPKDYRFCGYAEAVAGNLKAQQCWIEVTGLSDKDAAAANYRFRLFGSACKPRPKGESLSLEVLEKVVKEQGQISLPELLLCRVRYLTEGAVLGSAGFVAEQLAEQKRKYNRVQALEPKTLPPLTDWGTLTVLRRPRAAICVR